MRLTRNVGRPVTYPHYCGARAGKGDEEINWRGPRPITDVEGPKPYLDPLTSNRESCWTNGCKSDGCSRLAPESRFMDFPTLLSIAGSVLLALGGGSLVVFALAKWLGGVWAARILENERSAAVREHELLVRRRNVYSKLSVSLRVFLSASARHNEHDQKRFLEAYDEAALWAPDEVMNAIGHLLDLIKANTASRGSVGEEALQQAYTDAITAMRKDCGFTTTKFEYRVVSF